MKKAIFMMMLACMTAVTVSAAPDDYQTIETAGYTISLPKEFQTSSNLSNDYIQFRSNATNTWDDGEEHRSSAVINLTYQDGGGATPGNIKELAQNLKAMYKALGNICDEPKVVDNVVVLRMTDGDEEVSWSFVVVTKEGKNLNGQVEYKAGEAKFYDAMVERMAKSVKMK